MPKSFVVSSRAIAVPIRLRKRSLPTLEVKDSKIPLAGRGLFARQRIAKGDLVAEYGGRLVYRAEAEQLRASGQDTHLRAVTLGVQALDGRVQEPVFTDEYYAQNHLVGSYANQGPHSSANNTVYVPEGGSGRIHPYGGVALDRVFLKATRDIEEGSEILVNYGSTYSQLHLERALL
jgi:hypothetical protein